MDTLLVFEGSAWRDLFPLTVLKPSCELRVGYYTIAQGWTRYLRPQRLLYTVAAQYLADSFTSHEPDNLLTPQLHYCPFEQLSNWALPSTFHWDNVLSVSGSLLPTPRVARRVDSLLPGQALYFQGELIAFRGALREESEIIDCSESLAGEVRTLRHPWDLFQLAEFAISHDFSAWEEGNSALVSTVQLVGDPSLLRIHPSAELRCCTLNTEGGPILIGAEVEVMEGSHIRGPVAISAHAQVKMGAKIYGATSLGNYCKVGGEVSNSVFQSFSSKAHDGFIGNAAIGSWCNLGADTNCSNLKNTYSNVKVWSMALRKFEETGLLFCGLFMGDHSKSGINTMFNTGTVVGPFCNIFGSGFPRTWIPGFSFGGAQGFRGHSLADAMETASVVMARRGVELSDGDRDLFRGAYSELEGLR